MGTTLRGSLVAALLVAWGAAAPAAEPADRGAQVYADFCASCHGRYGHGDGPLAGSLVRRPPDFTDAAWRGGRSDEKVLQSLMGGGHASMAVGSVFAEDVLRDALGYVATLSVPGAHVSVPRGRDIYNAGCWVCHGRAGDGRGPGAPREGVRPRDFTSPEFVIEGREEEIAQTIAKGAAASFHGSPLMIEWGNRLSPEQIRDVVEYLKTFRR
jgi:mono/diheme cytochrome c family protein